MNNNNKSSLGTLYNFLSLSLSLSLFKYFIDEKTAQVHRLYT